MVKIISDSTCDLSQELLRKYEIDILPLHILLGDKEYEDGKNITPDQIYTWSDANKTTPKTSAPALADAMELFRPYAEAGREIVCFSISAGMSTSGNVMRLAAVILAPMPQPMIFVRIATIVRATAKRIRLPSSPASSVFMPIDAKKIGEKSM